MRLRRLCPVHTRLHDLTPCTKAGKAIRGPSVPPALSQSIPLHTPYLFPTTTTRTLYINEPHAHAHTHTHTHTLTHILEHAQVSPQPKCGVKTNNVSALEACCTATTGCGGFNTNGIIKKTDCTAHVKAEPACDLYLKEDHPQPPPPPPLWPQPASGTFGIIQGLQVSSGFTFTTSAKSPTLSAAFARYKAIMFPHAATTTAATTATTGIRGNAAEGAEGAEAAEGASMLSGATVVITATVDESHPQLETDESYELNIPGDGSVATITAPTIYGALHGIETLYVV